MRVSSSGGPNGRVRGSSPPTTGPDSGWCSAGRASSDRCGAASLADAVTASCSIPAWYAPTVIDGVPYIDGGTISIASVDLLRGTGVDEVYVFAPMASVEIDRARTAVGRVERAVRRAITRGIMADVARLRAGGARVCLITPSRTTSRRWASNDESRAAGRGSRHGTGNRGTAVAPAADGPGGMDVRADRRLGGTVLRVRVYVPATSTVLRHLIETGQLGGVPQTAFAVTPGLREWYLDDDVEELEYAAMSEAARASLRLIDADDPAPRAGGWSWRRTCPTRGRGARRPGSGRRRGGAAVALAGVASVHVDDADAEAAVAAAAAGDHRR